MSIKRREFLDLTTKATVATGLFATMAACKNNEQPIEETSKEPKLNMFSDIEPISREEREQRILKAQKLMVEQGIEALIIDSGTSLDYFTGIYWWPSERTMVAIIPSRGYVYYICPAFEEDRLRENVTIGNEILVWQEDESPFELIVNSLKDKGIASGNIALENELRFFIMDGIRKETSSFNFVSDTVAKDCRMTKSTTEIALMQRAFEITAEAIKAGISQLREGMSQDELSGIIGKAHGDMGAMHDFALVLFGISSSFPHGSKIPQTLKKSDVVLMDCGCKVHGYSSDITRTIIFGEPTTKQLDIWNLEKKAQEAGFNAAQLGATCGSVDASSRKVITDAGFGPDYKVPGLPHRTGHGIGMDGHEFPYLVKDNAQVLAPGMCFSIEPTIAIPGEFGIRLEDCAYMTENGPKWFVQPSPSIDQPFV